MSRADVEWFVSELKKHMIANVEGILGPDTSKGDVDEVVCLNRIFRYCRAEDGAPDAVEIEADGWGKEWLEEKLYEVCPQRSDLAVYL